MKKVCVVILVLFVFCLFAGCGAGGAQEEVSPLVGTWKGSDLMEETFEFKADGTGHNAVSYTHLDVYRRQFLSL